MQGAPEEQVQSAILGSQEFFNRANLLENSSKAGNSYVAALYSILLHRGAAALEINGWSGSLTPANRSLVALGFLQSGEYRSDVVIGFYSALLHRNSPPSAGEVANWVGSPLDISAIRIGFESSLEFFL
jgi:hypothetical protein